MPFGSNWGAGRTQPVGRGGAEHRGSGAVDPLGQRRRSAVDDRVEHPGDVRRRYTGDCEGPNRLVDVRDVGLVEHAGVPRCGRVADQPACGVLVDRQPAERFVVAHRVDHQACPEDSGRKPIHAHGQRLA